MGNNFHFNKWQRLIALLAAAICITHAWTVYFDDDRLGMSFVASVILLIACLSRPAEGEDWLPFVRKITKRQIKVASISAGVCGAAIALLILSKGHEVPAYPIGAATEPVPEEVTFPALPEPPIPTRSAPPVTIPAPQPTTASTPVATVPFDYIDKLRAREEQAAPDPVEETLRAMRTRRTAPDDNQPSEGIEAQPEP